MEKGNERGAPGKLAGHMELSFSWECAVTATGLDLDPICVLYLWCESEVESGFESGFAMAGQSLR